MYAFQAFYSIYQYLTIPKKVSMLPYYPFPPSACRGSQRIEIHHIR